MARKAAAATAAEKSPVSDKRTAVETVMARIERECGKGSIMRLGENGAMNVSAVSTGSLTLDFALGIGGIPRGRITEIYGPESSGKTTIALHVIAEAQKQGGEAAFIDAEHALDPVYAKKIGVDINNLCLYKLLCSFHRYRVNIDRSKHLKFRIRKIGKDIIRKCCRQSIKIQ